MSDAMDPKPGTPYAGHDTVSPTLLPPRAGKPRRWILWVALVVLALIGYAVFHAVQRSTGAGKGGPGGRGAAMAGKPMPVMVATAAKGDINVVLTALGNVTPVNNVTVKTRVDGQLVRLAFAEGQTVKGRRPAGRDRPPRLPGPARPG